MTPKPKNQPDNRLLRTVLYVLIVLLAIGLGGAVGVLTGLLYVPSLFQFPATVTALAQQSQAQQTRQAELSQTQAVQVGIATQNALMAAQTAQALRNTQTAQDTQATQTAQALQITQSALNNWAFQLQQTATQSQRQVYATQTAQSINTARQGTQIALDYAATQSELQRQATQAELNYQATQSALGNNANANPRLAFVTATATPSATLTPTATATHTSTPRPSHTPTLTPTQTLKTEFRLVLDETLWQLSAVSAWQAVDNGLQAQENGAWLLTRGAYSGDYVLEVAFAPALATQADYVILFDMNANTGFAWMLDTNALQAQTLNLYTVSLAALATLDAQTPLTTLTTQTPLTSPTRVRITREGQSVTITLNDTMTHTITTEGRPFSGQVGVQLPMGAILTHLSIQATE